MPALPVVLVPGLLCTGALFSAQRAVLAEARDVHIGRHAEHATMADIARAILQDAPARFALAGLSMGGYIAFEMLRQAPDRIDRLALLDTSARADRPEQAAQRRALVATARAEGIAKVSNELLDVLIHHARRTDMILLSVISAMAQETGVEAFARQQEAIIGRPDNRPFLAQVRCPTVIVVGAQDALTPVKVAEEMHAGIAGSRLEVIADCGHLAPLERPERVTEILTGWLDS